MPGPFGRVGNNQNVVKPIVDNLPLRRCNLRVAGADRNPALLRIHARDLDFDFAHIAKGAAFIIGLFAGHHQAQLVHTLVNINSHLFDAAGGVKGRHVGIGHMNHTGGILGVGVEIIIDIRQPKLTW